jgi:putative ABC transport system substrate-binding protein
MKRREFIAALGGAAVPWPIAARAQQAVMPVIGFLSGRSPDESSSNLDVFRRGLREAGFIEGQNVAIQYRYAHGRYDQLPELARDLVNRRVDVITAMGGAPGALAAKDATRTIPIVFHIGLGLVASLNRPGGNTTGVAMLTAATWTKRLELADTIADKNAPVGVLLNPNYPGTDPASDDMQGAAEALGRRLVFAGAVTEKEIEKSFESLAQTKPGAVVISTDPFFLSERDAIVALAARFRLPIVCGWEEEAKAGCLISYGADQTDTYYQVGLYTGQILKGAKPADLPVVQPTRFYLVINLKTARALGITVPPALLARADEVIE